MSDTLCHDFGKSQSSRELEKDRGLAGEGKVSLGEGYIQVIYNQQDETRTDIILSQTSATTAKGHKCSTILKPEIEKSQPTVACYIKPHKLM